MSCNVDLRVKLFTFQKAFPVARINSLQKLNHVDSSLCNSEGTRKWMIVEPLVEFYLLVNNQPCSLLTFFTYHKQQVLDERKGGVGGSKWLGGFKCPWKRETDRAFAVCNRRSHFQTLWWIFRFLSLFYFFHIFPDELQHDIIVPIIKCSIPIRILFLWLSNIISIHVSNE